MEKISWSTNLNSKENFAAFKIQLFWKEWKIIKELKNKQKNSINKIKVFTSLINADHTVDHNTRIVRHILKVKGYRYEEIDLSMYPSKKKLIPLYTFRLPVVMVNNLCLGEYPDFQILEDNEVLEYIIRLGNLL